MDEFMNRLTTGQSFCTERNGTMWYLEQEAGHYVVRSSAAEQVSFEGLASAIFFFLARIGEWQ